MPDPALVAAWWSALGLLKPLDELQALLDAGVPVDLRDRFGATGLFRCVRDGGSMKHLLWLIAQGADVNARNDRGESVVEAAVGGCASALERNMAEGLVLALRAHGFREQPGGAPVLADYLGRWFVAGDPLAGKALYLGREGLRGAGLDLDFDQAAEVVAGGRFEADGERAGLLVHLSLTLEADNRASLCWQDGVTFALELRLQRLRPEGGASGRR